MNLRLSQETCLFLLCCVAFICSQTFMVILSHSELAELLWLLRSIQLKSNFGRFQKPGYQFWNIMKQSKLQFYILVTPQFNFRYGESIYTQAMLKQPCGNMSYLAWEMEPWQLTFQHFHSYFHHRLRATQSVRSPFDYFSKSTRSKDSTWTQRRALFISESNSNLPYFPWPFLYGL